MIPLIYRNKIRSFFYVYGIAWFRSHLKRSLSQIGRKSSVETATIPFSLLPESRIIFTDLTSALSFHSILHFVLSQCWPHFLFGTVVFSHSFVLCHVSFLQQSSWMYPKQSFWFVNAYHLIEVDKISMFSSHLFPLSAHKNLYKKVFYFHVIWPVMNLTLFLCVS